MKKYILLFSFLAVLFSCKEKKENTPVVEAEPTSNYQPISHQDLENAVIYEANIRQYSPEGTFNAFTKDIPQLKELGVKIIWLMPIHPISVEKRKAKGDLLVADIEDEAERKKYLGSPYAVANYTQVNPDMGTMEDFENLVNTAHENGMYVILDWVPNHTGWDHPWISEHPEYYTQNDKGEIVDPVKDDGTSWGWTDVADLNYNNQEMRKAMLNEMLFWVKQQNIDGFRCDVAHGVPQDFWEQCIPALRAEKDLFMLAEAELPNLMKGNTLFDMSYAWEGHHIFNEIAQGKKQVPAFNTYIDSLKVKLEPDDILMNFVTNHDENAWAGPLKERMGDASEVFTALSYVIPGMPLIYSGQEYDMDYTLNFFGKDTIPKTKGKMWPLLQKLGALKNNEVALNGGKQAALYETITTSNNNNILAFNRAKNSEKIVFIANLSAQNTTFTLPLAGTFKNALTGEEVILKENESHQFKPWQYLILK